MDKLTVRRTYGYLLAFAGLTMLALGAANLLQVAIDVTVHSPSIGTGNDVRDTVSRNVAVVLVGLPVWLIHWWWIERWLACPSERASTLRRLYLYAVLAVSALTAAYSLHDGLRIAIEIGLGGRSNEIWERTLAFTVPSAAIWLFHWRIATRDRAVVGESGGSATLRRWYVYGLAFVGLAMLLSGTQGLLEGLWTLLGSPGSAPNSESASASALLPSPAASALVGAGLWVGGWGLLARHRDDGTATLRSVYLFLALTLAVAGTLYGLSELLYYAVARLLGIKSPGGVGGDLLQAAAGPTTVALVYGIAWAYQRTAVRRQAGAFTEQPRQAGVRHLYDYLLALVALSVLATGAAGLLWTLGDVLFNRLAGTGGDGWRDGVSLFSTMTLVGLPVWLLHWRPTPTRASETGSLARRLYLYLSLIGATLTLLGSAAAALYRVIGLTLGEASSLDLRADLAHAAALGIVSASIAAYHWRVLRADAARGPVSPEPEVAEPAVPSLASGERYPGTVPHLLTARDFAPLRDDPAYMREALDAVEAAILAHHRGTVRQGRLVDRVPGEFEGLRVSLLAGEGLLSGMRVFGNPPHTRAFLLFDGTTRALLGLMDYGVLNSIRVGATAGVAARHLAPANASIVGLLGSGWQAPTQLTALKAALPGLSEIRVFSRTREHREAFADQMSRALEIPVNATSTAYEALHDADVVDLCAPGHFDVREPLFDSDWIKPGALVISMAHNQYPPDFESRASLIVDIPEVESIIPLGAVISKEVQPRLHDEDRVIYRLEGGTVQDLFIATWGFEWARARGAGQMFDLSA